MLIELVPRVLSPVAGSEAGHEDGLSSEPGLERSPRKWVRKDQTAGTGL